MTPTAFSTTTASLGFVHNRLDRQANRRDDESYLAGLASLPSARTLGVIGDAVVLRRPAGAGGGDPWFGLSEAERLGHPVERAFLGEDARGPVFATQIEAEAEVLLAGRPALALFNLRQLALDGSVSFDDLGAMAEGKALLFWHAKHRFCANCGMPTVASAGGWRRECPSCGTHHFPRTDPVVIMLAIDGERCLLGRQPRFPAGMYSCLAGFLEPGETIEAAVRREIAEEAGIATGTVTYLGSQPWPFPASLMIGCLVEAASTAITIDRQELEDARWFTRNDVKAMLAGRHPEGISCPFPMAIAHHIVLAWANARD